MALTERFRAATDKLEMARAKIAEMEAALDASRAAEQEALDEIQALVLELGIGTPAPADGQPAKTKTDQVLDALPGTADQISRETGLTLQFITATLSRLQNAGRVEKDGRAPGADGRLRNVYARAAKL